MHARSFNLLLFFSIFAVIPQTCKYKGRRFECGLSISCVLAGGKPIDSCSGGMIWSCCVDKELHQESTAGMVQNASKSTSQMKSKLPTSMCLLRVQSKKVECWSFLRRAINNFSRCDDKRNMKI